MLFALVAAAAVLAQDGRVYPFSLGKSPDVSVANVAGAIDVVCEPRDDVSVTVARTGPEWQVELQPAGTSLRARACCGGCGRVRGKCDGTSEVRFKLRVPAAARLLLTTVSGAVAVHAAGGPVQVEAVSGPVLIEGNAAAAAVTTVSGDVELAPRAVADTRVDTSSGRVRLRFPPQASARLSFQTVSGRFAGRRGARRLSLGKGAARIEVQTVNGDLELANASAAGD